MHAFLPAGIGVMSEEAKSKTKRGKAAGKSTKRRRGSKRSTPAEPATATKQASKLDQGSDQLDAWVTKLVANDAHVGDDARASARNRAAMLCIRAGQLIRAVSRHLKAEFKK